MSLYIAYGANLNRRSMRRRCPDARPLGRILLPNHRLVFRGVADVEPADGHAVPCGVWEISNADERALDRFEGVPSMYRKNRTIQLRWRGEQRTALIYLMNSNGIYPPNEAYAEIIREGYSNFNLDTSYFDDALRRSFEEKFPDDQTRQRRARQLRDPVTAPLARKPLVAEED